MFDHSRTPIPSATSTAENRRYNAELDLVESLYEFHVDAFSVLTESELLSLKKYYLLGEETPSNVFMYRAQLLQKDSQIASQAERAFRRVCESLGIDFDSKTAHKTR